MVRKRWAGTEESPAPFSQLRDHIRAEPGGVGSPAAAHRIPAGQHQRRLVKDLGNKDRKYFPASASVCEAVIGGMSMGCLFAGRAGCALAML